MSFVLKPNRFASRRCVTQGSCYSVDTLIRSNTNYDRLHESYLYMDQFSLILDRNLYNTYVGGGFLSNADLMLKTLPQDEPISGSTVWALLVSAFGNAAKKKLRELSTPKAILAWLETSPIEIAELMGVTLLPIRTVEAFNAYKLANGFKVETTPDAPLATTPEAAPPPKRRRQPTPVGMTLADLVVAAEVIYPTTRDDAVDPGLAAAITAATPYMTTTASTTGTF